VTAPKIIVRAGRMECPNRLIMIELVSAIGFYAMVAMTLNAFAVPVPEGKEGLA